MQRTPASSAARADDELLRLDPHTFRDLEIFESETGGRTLFDLCNLTRSAGGERAMRRRMERPWSNPARIRATQESLSFILDRRAAFDRLPSLAYTTGRVERYAQENLPLITHENRLEFGFGVIDLRLNHDRDYPKIVRGVQVTCGLIRALRGFVRQAELASPDGELAAILEELRTLLEQSRLSLVPDHELHDSGPWRILRIDQIFRLHEKGSLSRLLQLIYQTEALVALADVTGKHGFVLPSVDEGPLRVHAEGLKHPLIENASSNPVELDQARRILFLTGPNMAGKTTYLRSFATALYFAHLGMGVPALSFRFVPAERLFSSISLNDDLSRGVSYFRAEALRVKAIAEAVAEGHRVVAIMDEPFKGTNVKDAFDASFAILEHLAVKKDCLFMFSSHLIELGERLRTLGPVDFCYFEAEEGEGQLRFEYLLRRGVSSQRLGMRVLREEGIFEILSRNPDEE